MNDFWPFENDLWTFCERFVDVLLTICGRLVNDLWTFYKRFVDVFCERFVDVL